MSIRAEKVASVIKRTLATHLQPYATEAQAGLVTVTSVKLSPDLQIAKVYLSVYGGKINSSQFVDIIENKKGQLRSLVGSSVKLRFTPELKFFVDDTLDEMERIQKLIDSVKPKEA